MKASLSYVCAALCLCFAAPLMAGPIPTGIPRSKGDLHEAVRQEDAGEAMLRDGQYAIAERDFQRTITLLPEDASAYRGLAESLAGLGQKAGAINIYRALFSKSSLNLGNQLEDVRTLAGYASLLDETGQWQDAVAFYSRALPQALSGMPTIDVRFDPEHPQPDLLAAALDIMLGWVAARDLDSTGKPETKAELKDFSDALKREPNWDLANFYYVYGLMDAGRAKEAQPAFNRLLDLNPNPQIRAALETRYGVVSKIDLATGRPVTNK